MKKFALIIALILTVFSFFILRENSVIGTIIVSLIAGIVVFFLLLLLLSPVKMSIDNLISDAEKQDLLSYAPVNYLRNCFVNSIGGVCFLYKDRLFFTPHKMNISKKEITLFICEIERVLGYKVCGIFDIGLIIVLKTGKKERFIIDKKSLLYKELLNVAHTAV